MMADPEIYRLAKELIDVCGPEATEHAYQMMRQFLAEDDPQVAGVWLAIGNAIEELKHMPPAHLLH